MSRVPDYLVEKVHLGEASDAERRLVLDDPAARARLEALPALDAAFFEKYPADEELRRIEARARVLGAREEASRRGGGRALAVLLAPAMAVAMASLFVVISNDPGTTAPVEVNRPKGLAPKLRVYRQRGEGVERLNSGVVARSGDTIQIGVVSGDSRHGVVVSVDGRGEVTLHWPTDPTEPTELRPGEQPMPTAYELDDAPEYERFFLVTSGDRPTDVSTVVHAAEALAAAGVARTGQLAVPPGYDQTSFVVRKEQLPGGGR